jgi:hypothetical protein
VVVGTRRATKTDEATVEPIPETVEALQELTRLGDRAIAGTLLRLSRDVERLVPDIVGLSLSLVKDDLTFTATATNGPVAELDGVQYLSGGPCHDALHDGRTHQFRGDRADDESRWQLFARATAAAGVESTLSLPILQDGRVVVGVNLYASTPTAFDGHHEELAEVCGALAVGAVSNADLGFTTRFRAAEAPERLRDQNVIDRAVGVLMAARSITAEEAEQQIRQAAQRAGITDSQMARAVLGLFIQP